MRKKVLARSGRRRPRLLGLLAVASAGAVAATTVLIGCGGDGGSGTDQPEADPDDRVPERAALIAGPALLPPADSELLAGLPVEMVVAPADVETLPADVADAGPGQLVLYGDPSAEDPLSSPWVLAVLHQGSENSGLGGAFDPHGTATSWTEVPVEQLSQESRHAGLLTSGLDDATVAELSKGVEVSGDETGGAGIEVRSAALGSGAETLELITAGSLDVAAIGSAWERGSVAPTVRWDERRPWPDPSRRLAVTSYAADPGLELLLRATNGGPAVGPSVMPVGSAPPDDVVIGVRTVGATTVLVQSTSVGVEGVEQVLDSVERAGDERFAALRDAFLSEAPSDAAAIMGDPEEMVSGTALGGRWFVAADIERVGSMIGPVDSCMVSVGFQFADGSFGGGGARGGYCTEFGSVSADLVHGKEAVLVHGDLPTNVARVEIVLDDGSVHEPELVGSRRLLFGFVVEGPRDEYSDPIVAARTYDAAGSPIVDLRDESLGQEAIERLAENWPSDPGG